MVRIHGLSSEQMGALLRLMADNQSFEDPSGRPAAAPPLPVLAHGSRTPRRRPERRKKIAPSLRLVSG